jgi:5'-3' exonuclease
MGIFNFFPWLKRTYPNCVNTINKKRVLPHSIDNFMIDGNCIYHPCAQSVYKYGGGKETKSLLRVDRVDRVDRVENINYNDPLVLEKKCFDQICATIDSLIKFVRPKKRFIMSSDGTAPLAKQFQQRCRRLKSSKEISQEQRDIFDSNCLTPGTEFMDRLSNYLHIFFTNKCASTHREDSVYNNLIIIFTNEKVPGEGEAKLMEFIRYTSQKNRESWCIYSADADLIMLALTTHEKRFYILRDNIYQKVVTEYFVVNVNELRKDLLSTIVEIEMKPHLFTDKKLETIFNDFVLMCFFAGNDFLPHIPTIEIKDGGIDIMLRLYKLFKSNLTYYDDYNCVQIDKSNLAEFLKLFSEKEQYMINQRVNGVQYNKCFPFPALDDNTTTDKSLTNRVVNLTEFRRQYYREKFNIDVDKQTRSIKAIVNAFIEGLQWVLTYYCNGLYNWDWKYPYQYAPFLSDISEHIKRYSQPVYGLTRPNEPFVQLLSVLPPASQQLIPKALRVIYEKFPEMYPEDVKVDLDGKRYEYEGTIIIPFIDDQKLKKEFSKIVDNCTSDEKKRNILTGKVLVYNGV